MNTNTKITFLLVFLLLAIGINTTSYADGGENWRENLAKLWNNKVVPTAQYIGTTAQEKWKETKNKATSIKESTTHFYKEHTPTTFKKLNEWGDSITHSIKHHQDPRLIALVASCGIVTTGGVCLACREKSSLRSRIIGAVCMIGGIIGIVISSNLLQWADTP